MAKVRKKKKHIRTILILLMILFLTIISFGVYSFSKYKYEKNQEELRIAREQRIKEKIEEISKNYNKVVKTDKEAIIYSFNDDEYTKVGLIGENIVLALDDIDIDEDTLYFPITNFKNKYYISYEDVIPFTEEVKNLDNRYKNYIPFNKSVQTNTTKLYKDDVLLYDIPESYTFPIYIMEKDKYYVEFNNELLYVLNDSNILKVFDNKNSDAKKATSIGTILYHFIMI